MKRLLTAFSKGFFSLMLFGATHALCQASVSTDLPDYPPGSTVYISGAGYAAGESVQLQVLRTDIDEEDGLQFEPWVVTADTNGNFTTTWDVTWDDNGATLQLTATGLSSGLTARTIFADSILAPVPIGNVGTGGGSSYSHFPVKITTAVSVGNTVIMAVVFDDSSPGSSVTVTDTSGNTYHKDADVEDNGGTRTLIFSAPVTTALTTSSTNYVNLGVASAAINASAVAVSGLVTSSPADQSATAINDTPSAGPVSVGPAGASSQANELLIGAFGLDFLGPGTTTFTNGTGYTALPTNAVSGNWGIYPEYEIVSQIGSYSATGTIGANVYDYSAAIVTYMALVGPGAKLAFTTQPTNSPAGAVMSNVVVQVEDATGNIVTSNNVPITLTLNTGSFTSGTLTTNTGSSGSATFNNLVINAVNTYTITAAASGIGTGLANGTSSSFNITPGPVNTLTVTQQPSGAATAGAALATQPKVSAADVLGNPVADGTAITATETSGGNLNGTTTAPTAPTTNGVATFSGLFITNAGTATLTFTANSVSVQSSNIVVGPAAASRLGMVTEPSASATAGVAFGTQPAVAVEDTYGNVISTNNTVTAALATGTGPLLGTTNVAAIAGVAGYGNLTDDREEGITLKFSAAGLTGVTDGTTIAVGPSNAVAVRVETMANGNGGVVPATNLIAGNSLTAYAIQRDTFGNFVTNIPADSWGLIVVTGGVVSGDLVPSGDSRSAVFTAHVSGAANIHAPSGSLTATDSGLVTVLSGAPSKLGITTAPQSLFAGTNSAIITVQIQDGGGSPTNATVARVVNLSSTSGSGIFLNPLGTLTNATLTIPIGQNSTNFLYRDTVAGTPTITAATTSPTTLTSGTQIENVHPAVAAKLAMKTEPSTPVLAGAAFATPAAVYVEDKYGNVVTNDSSTVTAALNTGTGPLQGTTAIAASAGVATFTSLADNLAESITLKFTDGSLTGVTDGTTITVNPAAIASYAVSAASPQITGTLFPTTVTAKDSFGNVVTTNSTTVVTMSSISGNVQFTGNPMTLSGGTLSIPTEDGVEEDVTLTATDSLSRSGSTNIQVQQVAWANVNWSYREAITLWHTNVFGTDQTNFPVLINMTNASLAANAMTNGFDIFFTSSNGVTKLPYEREKYVGSNGTLVAWVGVPLLSHAYDTVLYLYYGNAGATDQQQGTNVWDSNFKGVYHLNGTANSPDSTTNVNAGTWTNSPVPTNGMDDGALRFNGTSSQVTVNSVYGLATANVTMECWAYFSSTSLNGAFIKVGGTSPNQGYAIGVGNGTLNAVGNGMIMLYEGARWITPLVSYGTGWHHVVLVINASGYPVAYLDGAQVYTDASGAPLAPSVTSFIGGYQGSDGPRFFNGILDEVRISSAIRSAGWIQTEYTNQASPGRFFSVGPQTTDNASVVVETAPDGSGSVVQAQTIGAGSSITVYSIERDGFGAFVTNIPAAWSLPTATGGVASGDLVPAGNNQSAVFTGHMAGTAVIQASAGALPTTNSGLLTVVLGPASKLAMTTAPQSLTAGINSGIMTVQLQDAGGNATNATAPTIVNLSSTSGSGVFVNPAGSATNATLTIAVGQNSTNFLYEDTAAGAPTITAASTSPITLTSATQVETVNAAGASQLAITTAPVSVTAGVTSGTITVQSQDAFGNGQTNSTVITVHLASSSAGATFYNTNNVAITSTNILLNQTLASFLYKDTVAGGPIITNSGGSLSLGTQAETVVPAAATKLVVVIEPSAGAMAGAAFGTQPVVGVADVFGNIATNNASTVSAALLIGSGPLQGTTNLAVVNGIAAFNNLSDNLAESIKLRYTDGALTPVTNTTTISVGPAAPNKLAFTTAPFTVPARLVWGPITVQSQDLYGNPTNSSVVTVGLSSTSGGATFYNTNGVVISSTNILANQTLAGFLYKDTLAGTPTLTASASGLTSGTQNETVTSGSSRYSVANGVWSSSSVWATNSGGTPGAPAPAAGDTVIIEGGHTVTVDASGEACSTLQIGSPNTTAGGTGTLTFAASGSPQLTVSGAVTNGGFGAAGRNGTITFTSGSSLTAGSLVMGNPGGTGGGGTITMSAGGTLSLGGAITVNTGATGNLWTPGSGTVILTATNTLPSSLMTTFTNLQIAGGTTTLGVGITVTNLSLTSGTLDASSGHNYGITIGGNWTNNGGTFLPEAGTVTFNGSTAQAIQGSAASQTFNNLTVNMTSGQTLSVNSGTTLNVTNFTETTGNFTAPANLNIYTNVTLNAGIFTAGATTSVGGNWSYNSGATFTANGGKVIFNGLAAQSILGSATTSFSSLEIANTAATVSGTVNFNVSGTMTVDPGAAFVPGAAVVINNSAAAGTLNGSGNIQVTRITATADLVDQYKFSSYTLGSMTVNYSGAGPQTVNASSAVGNYGYLQITGGSSYTKTLGGAITVNNDLTIAASTVLAAVNYNLSLGGNWTNNAGAPGFTTGAAQTVTLQGSAQSLGGSGATTFDNLQVNVGSTATMNASEVVAGTLTLNGAMSVGANTLTLNGPAIGGTPANLSTTSFSTLIFGGVSASLNVPSSVAALSNLTISNANGLTLNSSPSVSTLSLSNGVIVTGGNTLTVANISNTAIIGGSSSSYVNGYLQKQFGTTGNPQTFTFPIGGASAYTPLALTNLTVGTAGNLTVNTTAGNEPQIATSGLISTNCVNRYWTLTPAGGFAATYNATFNYVAGDLDAGSKPSFFVVRQYSSGAWTTTTLVGTPSGTAATIGGETGFGDFAIGDQAASGVVFVQQPTTTVAGAIISPAITVQVTDLLGAGVQSNTVVMSLGSGTGTLSGTSNQIANASGLATFTNLSINLTGDKQLTATSGGASTNSVVFTITPGGLDHYQVSVASATRAIPFSVAVAAQDVNNNTVTTDNSTPVTMSASSANLLYALNPVTPTNGTFTVGASDNFPETVTLTATDPNGKTGSMTLSLTNSAGDFRSHQTGNWSNVTNWELWNGTNWITPAPFVPTGTNNILVQGAHTITNDTAVASLTGFLDAQGTLRFSGSGAISVGSGGIVRNSGTITSSATTLIFNSGGTYQHNYTATAGTVPTAAWNSGSTCEIIGYTSYSTINAPPGGLMQSFYNFTWNCPSQTGAIDLSGPSAGNVTFAWGGNFTVVSTGSGSIDLRQSGDNATFGPIFTIGGNFIIQSGIVNGNTGTVLTGLNLGGSYIQTGGTNQSTGGAGNFTFNFTGVNQTLTVSGGTNNMSNMNVVVTNGASLTLNNTIYSVSQIFTVNGVLNCGTNVVSGSGTFTLSSGGTLGIGSTAGITTSGSTGNIQTTTRNYNAAGNYIYNGTAAQVTGNGLATANNLTITNSAGVTLSGSATVSGTLALNSGVFAVGANVLTLNGPTIAGTPANLSTTVSSSLAFGGSSAGVNLPSSVTALSNLTINNTNGLTLNSSPGVTNLTLTSGVITTGPNTLIISNTSNSAITGGSGGSYVYGNLQKQFGTTASQVFTFPIGDATTTNFVTLLNLSPSVSGAITASTTSGNHPQLATSGINASSDVSQYWTLSSPSGTFGAFGVVFGYPSSKAAGTATNYVAREYNGSAWTGATLSGTPTNTAAGISGQSTFGAFAIGDQAVVSMAFGQQPTTTVAGVSITPAVTVTNLDLLGYGVEYASDVMTLSSGTGLLSGTTTQPANASGVATFNNLSINLTGTNKQLTATSGGASVLSATFTIIPAAVTKLGVITEPSASATAGVAFSPPPAVAVEDTFGNVSTTNTSTVTAVLLAGSGPLQGATSVAVVNGIATFSNLADNKAESIQLRYTDGALTPVTNTTTIVVSPAAATSVRVETMANGNGVVLPATNLFAGNTITNYAIQRDSFGNFVTNIPADSWSVINATGGVAGGDLVPSGDSKSAVFTAHLKGTANIQATSGSLYTTNSGLVTVLGGPPSQLVILTAPQSLYAGTNSAIMTVQIQDAGGNPTNATARTVNLASTSAGATFYNTNGTTVITTTNIAASQTSASFIYKDTVAGTPTITNSATGLTSGTQVEIVHPAVAVKLAMKTEPSATAAAGVAFATQPAVAVEDQYGNVVTNDSSTVMAALKSGTGPLQGTTSLSASAGLATFTNLADNLVESIILKFSDGSLAGLTDATTIVVSPGPIASYAVSAASPQTAGVAFTTTVTAKDGFGNVATNNSSTVVTMSASSGNVTFTGNPMTLNNGAFSITTLDSAEETVTLTATDSLSRAGSTNVVVQQVAWDTNSWAYRQKITIWHTNVFGTDQTNFPVLISLTNASLSAHALTNGNDILFTASDGLTKLSYEREKYVSSNGVLVAWVGVPILSHAVDTVLFMYYGNPSATDQQQAASVWDASYQGVYHLNGATNSPDSTSKANKGAWVGSPVPTNGMVDGGLYFNGSSCDATVNTNYGLTAANVTMECWAYISSTSLSGAFIKLGGQKSGYGIGVGSATEFDQTGNNLAMLYEQQRWIGTSVAYGTGWHHVVFVINASGYPIAYLDGVQVYTDTSSPGALAPATNSFIGGYQGDTSARFFNGILDEVRISSAVRSPGWIQTEYTNQASPARFFSLGSEVTDNTTITVISSANPSTYGQSVTFTANVTGSGGTPAGTIQFMTNGANFGAPVTLSGGSAASAAVSVWSAGTYTVTAVYSGDSYFNTNAGTLTGGQVVGPATLTVTPNAALVAYSGVALNNTNYSTNTANYSITGFTNGDTLSSAGLTLSGSMAFNSSTSTSVKNAGAYTQAVGTLALSSANGNYAMSFTNPTPNNYVISAATLTVTPNAVLAPYSGVALDNTNYSTNTANYSITGFQNSESVASAGVTLSGSMAFNGSTSTLVENVGAYTQAVGTLSLSSANGNYQMTFSNPTPNNYAIMAATLTVTPNAVSVVYSGVALDNTNYSTNTANYSITGFQNSETLSSAGVALSGSMAFNGSTTNIVLNAGTYTQAVGTLALTAANYTMAFANPAPNNYVILMAGTMTTVATSLNPALPTDTVTFTATVSALLPSAATPTGTVLFTGGGNSLASPVVLSNGQAAISLVASNIGHGSLVIAALYTNLDGNFTNSSGSLSPNQIVDTPPVGLTHIIGTPENSVLAFAASKLANNDYDADGDPLTVTAVELASTNGGTVGLTNGVITYTPISFYVGSDSFTYTVSDPYNESGTGTVNVHVRAIQLMETISISPLPDGNYTLIGTGIAGDYYVFLASPNVSGGPWTPISTNVAAANGLILYNDYDATNHNTRYYRLSTP